SDLINVRFGTLYGLKSDFCRGPRSAKSCREQMQRRAVLFDDLVGERDKLVWHLQPERLCSLEVDDQLEFGRILHGQLAHSLSLENAIDIRCRTPVHISNVKSIRDETAAPGIKAVRIYGRQA